MVSKVDEKVLAAVSAALTKNPEATVDELFAMAKGLNSSIGRLNKRQFHARYPLQLKRKLSAGKRKKADKKAASAPRVRAAAASSAPSARDAVRASLLRFATDLVGAEDRKDVVKVVAGVDRYVDEVLKATGAN